MKHRSKKEVKTRFPTFNGSPSVFNPWLNFPTAYLLVVTQTQGADPMTTDGADPSTDLIRWTFTLSAEAMEAVRAHLADLGAEVFVRDGQTCHVFWEETEVDLDAAVEAIWSLAGESFEITQEEFHRLELHILHPDEEEDGDDEAAADEETHPEVNELEIRDL